MQLVLSSPFKTISNVKLNVYRIHRISIDFLRSPTNSKANFSLQLKGWRKNMENFCGSKPPEGGCGSRQAQGFYPLWQPTASVFHGNRRFADCDPIAQFDRFDPRTTIGLPLEVRAVSRALDFLIPVSEALPQRGTRDSNPQPRVPTRSQNRKRPNAQSHRANGGETCVLLADCRCSAEPLLETVFCTFPIKMVVYTSTKNYSNDTKGASWLVPCHELTGGVEAEAEVKEANFALQLKEWRENMENFCGSKPPEGGCGSRQAQGFYPLWQPTASVFHGNRRFADCDPIAQFDRFDPRTTIGLPLESPIMGDRTRSKKALLPSRLEWLLPYGKLNQGIKQEYPRWYLVDAEDKKFTDEVSAVICAQLDALFLSLYDLIDDNWRNTNNLAIIQVAGQQFNTLPWLADRRRPVRPPARPPARPRRSLPDPGLGPAALASALRPVRADGGEGGSRCADININPPHHR
ncbi:Lipoprotein signal peptidase [Frankliniella fusca]|uniref:Lipoprotein signal peptidase n=1 Tax=Frankliniella fusca TaxID=407009 RepID=A0AAE1GSL5_9NEOP|nr:Lipoprotein signal peptidase [Frankliniella fusca]